MQLTAYQNEGLRHLAGATALAYCGGRYLTMAANLPGKGGSARISSAIQV